MITHGLPRDHRAYAHPLSWGEWQALIATALAHFNCDPDWSEWDFLQHCLIGTAIRKQPNSPES